MLQLKQAPPMAHQVANMFSPPLLFSVGAAEFNLPHRRSLSVFLFKTPAIIANIYITAMFNALAFPVSFFRFVQKLAFNTVIAHVATLLPLCILS